MSDARLQLKVEAGKKSGWLAAFLNLIFPGAGYFYCDRKVLGVIAFIICLGLYIASDDGMIVAPLVIILFIDGFLAAGRHNKKLIKAVLAEESAKG